MKTHYTLKQKIGTLVLDAPRYCYFLLLSQLKQPNAWLKICDRNQTLNTSDQPFGVMCNWQWTSDLHLPKIYPFFGRLLFKKALRNFDFQLLKKPLAATRNNQEHNLVSFIIGHRGEERLPLLLKTLESISAQKGCQFECIVIEQDHSPLIKEQLPSWVKYHFTPTDKPDTPFSRALAFNVGAQVASGDCFIFHDNDLLIPSNYANKTLELAQQGYDFINLKRFIYYLTEADTKELLTQSFIPMSFTPESIMQNAQGGGSIGGKRSSYFKIGGFDERFIGWGGEDNEFWERALTSNMWEHGSMPLIHLWHKPQKEKLDIQNSNTKRLYTELSKTPPLERINSLTKNKNDTKEAW